VLLDLVLQSLVHEQVVTELSASSRVLDGCLGSAARVVLPASSFWQWKKRMVPLLVVLCPERLLEAWL